MSELIYGVHPVLAALRQRGEAIEEIFIAQGTGGAWLQEVRSLAGKNGVRLRIYERTALDRFSRTTHHQGIIARIGGYHYVSEDELLDRLQTASDPPLIVIADSLQDPMNLGNLIRSAAAAGAHGLILPKDRAVGITPTVVKAAAGALEYLPIARVTNLTELLKRLKDKGLWALGAEAGASQSIYQADLTLPLALVVGSEGQGMRPRVRKECDLLLSIPMASLGVGSLNAATAGAVFLFEIRRQRLAKLAE
jgi:23S rRNA (guanosine2251-2'-O)-methyltransferase